MAAVGNAAFEGESRSLIWTDELLFITSEKHSSEGKSKKKYVQLTPLFIPCIYYVQ